jgi:cyclopropane-fatty-acyl-phospholipid synthase
MPYPDHAPPLEPERLLDGANFPRPRLLSWRGRARRMLHGLTASLKYGHLVIQLPDGTQVARRAEAPGPEGVYVVHRWRALRRLLLDGEVGFAESYMDDDWSSPDLAALIELAARNCADAGFGRRISGTALVRLMNRLRHWASANTRRGSRRNVVHHYDLGNDFYAGWLDAGMTYSAGLFTGPHCSLEAAQQAKQDRVCALLQPAAGQSVLEIGCGWGGLAQLLIERFGCRVTGLTLSPAQLGYATARLARAGVTGQVDLRLQDYRDVRGTFDRIVSIEMLEAVGRDYWPTYFAVLRDRLAPGGIAVLQAISIAEDRFDDYRRGPDFIQKYIFPGGMLPTVAAIRAEVARAGLVLTSMEHFGASYARTLAAWRERFLAGWETAAWRGAPGFSDSFRRMWDYYLSYCEGGFRAGSIDVGLYCLVKPR